MRASRSWRWSVVGGSLLAACSTNSGATGGDASTARSDLGVADASDVGSTALPDGWVGPSFDVPARVDAGAAATDGAAADARDALTVTTLPDGAMTACGTRERCDNGIDDDCNGMTDEECSCLPGSTQPCYPGDPLRAGRGVCTLGTQRCGGTGEFGTWGACAGFGQPRAINCAMPTLDNRCDGNPGVGCLCMPGASRSCYGGPAGT
ncbi:MAG: Tryptophan synthase alpha chain, partial [Myxococcaceae bacterium]|nr:Tryptophan synthase alpha chain [Myxococcaceae bacterium]